MKSEGTLGVAVRGFTEVKKETLKLLQCLPRMRNFIFGYY